MKNLSIRQKEIIDSAISLIASGGIQNLSMRNISEKMSISEPAIYRHFKSKLDVLATILDYFEQESSNLFNEIDLLDESGVNKLKIFFLKKCKQFSDNPEFSSVIFSEEIFQNETKLSSKLNEIMKFNNKKILQMIQICVDSGEIRNDIDKNHLAIMFLGSLRLLVKKWRLSNFSFDIVKESENIWNSLYMVMKKEN